MAFEYGHNLDDPGLPSLNPDRLALGMIDVQIARRDHDRWKVRAMQLIWRFFWAVWWGLLVGAIALSLILARG